MASELAQDYAAEFDRDWTAAENTPVEFPPMDVNALIKQHFRLGRELVASKSMLWDLLVRQAHAMDIYVPCRIKPGSMRTFSTEESDFIRVSDQPVWTDDTRYTQVIQRVFVDNDRRAVLHLGTGHMTTPDGEYLWAGADQPLYHIEWVVTGTETRPILRRRMVHLTDAPDARLAWYFARLMREKPMVESLEIYLREQWGLDTAHHPISA
ncbi:hypothetical protein LWC34_51090 [Kibdelosporangium philippinense]|uniref:SRPBCC family protein n=1 Tax=Kibdelosporangium philippinense TaxID=211113 RepID=A0ABS8ZV23_9PSEU|nr:hypothetical protein [Kibdelosporangium philippinense]MCE7011098.1 hypothetical protein [Kibdelosporangium philippinense]